MTVTRVMLRAYRSFNFDYRRKLETRESDFPACRAPWETEDSIDLWRPWVQMPIAGPIATIVGVNECGKTHLIDAIWKMSTQERLLPEDVCRYSDEGRLAEVSGL